MEIRVALLRQDVETKRAVDPVLARATRQVVGAAAADQHVLASGAVQTHETGERRGIEGVGVVVARQGDFVEGALGESVGLQRGGIDQGGGGEIPIPGPLLLGCRTRKNPLTGCRCLPGPR